MVFIKTILLPDSIAGWQCASAPDTLEYALYLRYINKTHRCGA
ncbi:hypothetical protein EBL_c10820 [Shimwellia blattae DSM 4481 = NBRC 105725]|uniref:Uncharacterized protein n=1 Tax=Shimwellia blattae (strain ATCC 29907 / DSM 4481 / JCM 1650 / NBRC 105725 / CDC 9005-74) TaxID=630626 RepID=I2B6N8_SHIBC|nr:hypothetical protein EBL_c10820 [Shimwellia blattae DSM 4481 = NBRC 105725]